MDSREDFRARVAALEQQTEHLKQQTQAFAVQTHALQAHTRTVERRLRWWRGLVCGILLMGLVSLPLPSGTAQSPAEETLAQRVAALEHTLRYVTSGEKEVVITGANLRIVNGLGQTDCGSEEVAIPHCPNGLGNLIVGYNEEREFGQANAYGLTQRGGGERAQFLPLRRHRRRQLERDQRRFRLRQWGRKQHGQRRFRLRQRGVVQHGQWHTCLGQWRVP